MALILILIGLSMIVSGARDTYNAYGKQLEKDMLGDGGFLRWLLALVMAGMLGYIDKLRPFSLALMTLVLVAVLLKKGPNVFNQLSDAVSKGPIAPAVDKSAEGLSILPKSPSGSTIGGIINSIAGVSNAPQSPAQLQGTQEFVKGLQQAAPLMLGF